MNKEKESLNLKEETIPVKGKLTYNEILLEYDHSKDVNDFELMGNSILIRPFKLEEIQNDKGLIITMNTSIMQDDPDTFKTKLKDMDYPYQYKGVVIKLGVNVSNKNFKVGDVVSFMRQRFEIVEFFIDDNNYVSKTEKFFTVKINENMIEKVYKK